MSSYAVTRRTHEFGVRMAVGARSTDIVRLVVSGGARLAIAGVFAGMAGALGVTRLLAAHVYDARPNDAATITAVVLALTAVGVAGASWLLAERPAWIRMLHSGAIDAIYESRAACRSARV
ncbi:MAG TPA: FtsX-like permease family protein [Bryobacteraceae bacterium]|nr:FtsX-like permease family protein [Bryobacteraceae bacterium]